MDLRVDFSLLTPCLNLLLRRRSTSRSSGKVLHSTATGTKSPGFFPGPQNYLPSTVTPPHVTHQYPVADQAIFGLHTNSPLHLPLMCFPVAHSAHTVSPTVFIVKATRKPLEPLRTRNAGASKAATLAPQIRSFPSNKSSPRHSLTSYPLDEHTARSTFSNNFSNKPFGFLILHQTKFTHR